ncbi:hypothetical protein ACIRVK_07295 [Streptomyces sp. NPDC101152]|uniref:hypothetical protein n=1 Tax=Streptomyces sp. NPDC101152 TaxID=3366116 RepID=UPI0037F6C7CE
MGSARITLCAAALAVVAFAPTAYAQDGGVWVNPATPVPGSDVALRVSGCAEKTATAVSAAFVADARLSVADGALVGETRVRSSLTVGTYDVTVTCGTSRRTSTLTVGQDTARPSAPANVPASPVAPVHAGGGGTARLSSSGVRAAGPGTAHAVTGLVLAGVAAAAVAVLGGRRRRGTG